MQCNGLREVSPPVTQRCDSRLRCDWQGDRDARAQGRVQRIVVLGNSTDYSERFAVQVCSVQRKAVVGLYPTWL